jgi:hypothetical protein
MFDSNNINIFIFLIIVSIASTISIITGIISQESTETSSSNTGTTKNRYLFD